MTLVVATSAGAQLKQGVLKNVTRITTDKERHENPRWSPDGSMIAFTDEGYDNLYIMGADGGSQKQISSRAGVGYGYSWSADGNEILVRDTRWNNTSGQINRAHALFAVSTGGTEVKLSEDAEYMQPAAWKYALNGAKSVVAPGVNLTSAGSSLKPLSAARRKAVAETPAAKLSFITDGEALYSVTSDGTQKKIFASAAFCPALSPDGKKVAFVADDQVCVMNVDGTSVKRFARGFNPAWLNNSQIVFEQTTDDGHTYLSGELVMLNIENAATKRLTSTPGMIEMQPSVSPDGTKLSFISFTDGQIYVAEIN